MASPLATLVPGVADQTSYMVIGAGICYFIFHVLFKQDASLAGFAAYIAAAKAKAEEKKQIASMLDIIAEHPEHGPELMGRLARTDVKVPDLKPKI